MTPVASGRSVYETLILSPRRNIKGVKALGCQVYSYANRGAAHIHTNSAFVQIRTVCSRWLKFRPLPQVFSNWPHTTIGTKDEVGDMT